MAFDFPNAPTAGQIYSPSAGVSYQFNDGRWVEYRPVIVNDSYSKSQSDIRYVDAAGDTMTGNFTIANAAAAHNVLRLSKSAAGFANQIFGATAGSDRWRMNFGDATAETGSNAGSNFSVSRYTDAGVLIDAPYVIDRNTGYNTMPVLRVTGLGDVDLATTDHPFQVGLSTDINIAIDGNEIMSRANGAAAALHINLSGGDVVLGASLTPRVNGVGNIGAPTFRWNTVYTSDLSLSNGIGDWTIVEGEDDLFLYNNKRGKVYKFALTEVDPSEAPPKKEE